MINIRLVREEDLDILAEIYKDLYGNSVLEEDWSVEKSKALFKFYYTLQTDLFLVAETDGKVVGAVMSLVKPWHDGNRLIETEIFVASNYQKQGIASKLFHEHFKIAMEKYDAKFMEAHTYQEENGYPLNWYKKQGYEIINEWYIINGNIKKAYEYFDKIIQE